MTGPLRYPGADCTTQWVGKGSVTMPMDHVKWGVHTTEGTSWPAYDYVVNGVTYKMGSAPTLTYHPDLHKWRQHFEINQSARAFKNDGDHYTNRASVIQTEVICICDDDVAAKYGHPARDIDDQAINDLGDFGVWCNKYWGLDIDFYPETLPWPKYPQGCPRMSWDRYNGFSGVLGHMAVPGNYHLDPGDLPMDRIKARMTQSQGDEFDMATLADLEKAVATALTTTKFPIDVAGRKTLQTLPGIIYNLEKQQDYDREQNAKVLAQQAALKTQLDGVLAAIEALPH